MIDGIPDEWQIDSAPAEDLAHQDGDGCALLLLGLALLISIGIVAWAIGGLL